MRVVTAALLCVAAAPATAATPARVRLVYIRAAGAESCPDAAAVRAGVTAQLGYDPFVEGATTLVTATVKPAHRRVSAHIELCDVDGTPLGTRDLTASSCAQLAAAIELAISIAVEGLSQSAPAPAPKPEPAPAPPAIVVPLPPQASDDEPPGIRRPVPPPTALSRRRRAFGSRIGFGFAAVFDGAPAPAFKISLLAAVVRPRWLLGVELRGDLPADAPGPFGGSIETSLVAGSIVPCLRHRIAAVCALVSFGAESGTGVTYTQARTVTGVWAALGGRLAVDLPLLPELFLQIHADLVAPLTRSELYVAPAPALNRAGVLAYRTPALSSAFGAVVVTQFP